MRPTRRRRPTKPPKAYCDVWGRCLKEGVAYYQTTSFYGEHVVLYACVDHDQWWAKRHPEMIRSLTRFGT